MYYVLCTLIYTNTYIHTYTHRRFQDRDGHFRGVGTSPSCGIQHTTVAEGTYYFTMYYVHSYTRPYTHTYSYTHTYIHTHTHTVPPPGSSVEELLRRSHEERTSEMAFAMAKSSQNARFGGRGDYRILDAGKHLQPGVASEDQSSAARRAPKGTYCVICICLLMLFSYAILYICLLMLFSYSIYVF
jgi:hypothetical protein